MKPNHPTKILIHASAASSPSYTVLAETPGRALKFLHTAAIAPQVFAALCAAGYTKQAHDEGWTLLLAATGYRSPDPTVSGDHANEAADALTEIEKSIGPLFKRTQAALRHMHPAQEAFVFNGLRVGRGAESTIAMTTYLDRCDELKNGKTRDATRREDHAALSTLEDRGIGVAERKRMHALIVIAQTPADVPVNLARDDDAPNARNENLVALHAWVQDWSETARAVIKNRAWLIRLGAAKRRARHVHPAAPVANPPPSDASPAL